MRVPIAALLCAGFLLPSCSDSGPSGPLVVDPSSTPTPSPTGPDLFPLPAFTAESSVLVAGIGKEPGSTLRVEGGAETVEALTGADGSFELDVELALDRKNHLFVTEVFTDGTQSPVHPLIIVQDGQPPQLWIDFPPAGAELAEANTHVSGRVGDLLSGFAGLEVTVAGLPADVDIGIGTNGTFDLSNFPLQGGAPTEIEVIATDALGNARSETVTVGHVPPTGSKLSTVAGKDQSGPVGDFLADPLRVRVVRADGSPYAGKLVRFAVVSSDGVLSAAAQQDPGRVLLVPTDGSGNVEVEWRLGSEAGCGNNRVAVTSNDIAGTLYFFASSTGAPASQVNLSMGSGQTAIAPGPAAEPLRVWVSDGCNPSADVPIEFSVVSGDASLRDAAGGFAPAVTVATGSTGHAEAQLELGTNPGPVLVEATFADNPGSPVVFTLQGVAPSAEPASFRGQVADNALSPIGGVRVRLVGPAGAELVTETSADGSFTIPEIPWSGPSDLYIDGPTADALGGVPIGPFDATFPGLHYEPIVLPGVQNALPTPILLPPLQPENAVAYDGSEDVVLTVAGVEGLEMRVFAGSVTFPDGSQPTPDQPLFVPLELALNAVHHDDLPMAMPDGAAPPFAWTLQPAGARFDPPVEVSYPNMSGLAPGAVAYFLSFDHDTSRFEIVSSARVTEDGSSIVSDPGSGLTVAGWGCNCPPYAVTGDCAKCAPSSNGCGSEAATLGIFPPSVSWVPDAWECVISGQVVPFADGVTGPCDNHDTCYFKCGQTQDGCDLAFLQDLKNACDIYLDDLLSLGCRQTCYGVAYVYYWAVTYFGEDSFASAQAECGCSPLGLAGAALSPEEVQEFLGIEFGADEDFDLLPDAWELANGLDPTDGTDAFLDYDGDMLLTVTEVAFGLDPFDPDTDGDGIDDGAEVEAFQSPLIRLGPSWTVTLNGQSVPVDEQGRFSLANISAADQFGPAGPGSAPDFLSDEFLRVTAVGEVGGETWYGFSDPFRIAQGETFAIEDLILTSEPPPLPESIRIELSDPLLEVGETAAATVFATLADGNIEEVSLAAQWTLYQTSNPAVVSIDQDGVLQANGVGSAFVTARNGGATSVAGLTVIDLDPPLTSVVGFVEFGDGSPAGGVQVRVLSQGLSTTTATDGYFQMPGVVTNLGPVAVLATTAVGGQSLSASSGGLEGLAGQPIDAGVLHLEPASSSGRDFLVAFPRNHDGSAAKTLFLASESATLGQVDVPALGLSLPFVVTPGEVTTVALPGEVELGAGVGISDLTVRITAEQEICVYGLSQVTFTTDAFAATPIESFGTEYRVLAYPGGEGAQVTVIASEPDTTVVLEAAVPFAGLAAGETQTVTLHAGEAYSLSATVGDASGLLVLSDKPVGVFGGNRCTQVPTGFSACDHLVEMLPPVATWGTEALAVDLAERTGADTFRILAAQDGTLVEVSGTVPESFTLDAGEFRELLLDGRNRITASDRILVCQYANGQQFDGSTGDPFQMLLPPTGQFQSAYTFATPASGFASHWVNVVAPSGLAASGQVLLDGQPVDAALFEAVGASGFSGAQVAIEAGSHVLEAPQPVGVTVYGFNGFDSYGYPGGMALGALGN